MCGITGFISSDLKMADLVSMTNAVQHRGPDAAGYFFDQTQKIGLGHRRLSILDLSDAANQPFHSHCGRYAMVFNGEVYNYRQIRQKLPHRNWKTDGDTEVILEAFAEWGKEAVQHFNGMFALAIYDKTTQALSFFRDRLGIKPLYYFQDGNELLFASELKAILPMVRHRLTISEQAVYHFLHLGYIPQQETIYRQIQKFPAGNYGLFKNGKWEFSTYWSAAEKITAQTLTNEQTAKAQLHGLLRDAVQLRLISDVPVGTFLSGGIDSSTVTAIAQELNGQPVKTFSIGFAEQTHNESQYAEQVANHLHTDHHSFLLTEKEALAKVDNLLRQYDQPFADSSAIPTLLVSEMARKHVTVALSGDGGDEQFMGYGMYQWANRLASPVAQFGRTFIKKGLELGNLRMQRAASLFDYQKGNNLLTHIFSQEQYLFSEKELQALLSPTFQKSVAITTNLPQQRNLSPAETQALFDLQHYLKDDLLVKVDIASMQHALEVRVPLLDYRVVEFSLNLDQRLKLQGKTAKYLLKQVLYDYVPARFFDRPKWGFSIPLGKWLAADLRYLLDQYLSEELIQAAGLVQYQQVQRLLKSFFEGKTFLYNRLWVLVLLHKWWKENHAGW